MKSVNVSVNGKTYKLEVGDVTTSPIQVKVEGQTFQVELDFPGDTVEVVKSIAPKVVAAPVISAAPVVTVAPVEAGAKAVRAPMPGTVVQVNVQPGDTVTRGQQLLSLEAMKMKNAIKSPYDGVISAVHVSDGQKVAFNDPMISFN
jgi:biotin carboxyl carrier protein